MTHAFFKALLFLGAGVVILALHHEHDMFKMGGLRKRAAASRSGRSSSARASLAALPLVTAGFYSKDLILCRAPGRRRAAARWLWAAGLVGALLTSLYTFRMVFLTFFGEAKQAPCHRGRASCMLAAAGRAGRSVDRRRVRRTARRRSATCRCFSRLPAARSLPATCAGGRHGRRAAALQLARRRPSLLGILLAYLLFLRSPASSARRVAPGGGALHRFWLAGWGFDWLYDTAASSGPSSGWRGSTAATSSTGFYRVIALARPRRCTVLLSRTQTGRVRWYAAGIAVGAVIVIAIVVFL